MNSVRPNIGVSRAILLRELGSEGGFGPPGRVKIVACLGAFRGGRASVWCDRPPGSVPGHPRSVPGHPGCGLD